MTQLTGLAYTTTGKIGFPYYRRGGLFQLFRKIPFGWEDLGEINFEEDYKGLYKQIDFFCKSIIHIGRDHDHSLFKFCPRCLVKVK